MKHALSTSLNQNYANQNPMFTWAPLYSTKGGWVPTLTSGPIRVTSRYSIYFSPKKLETIGSLCDFEEPLVPLFLDFWLHLHFVSKTAWIPSRVGIVTCMFLIHLRWNKYNFLVVSIAAKPLCPLTFSTNGRTQTHAVVCGGQVL